MRADDRGFIPSPRRLLRSIDVPEKDLKVLLKTGYVYQFPSGVVVILDWPVHNSVRRDRFVETTCQTELAQLEWQPGRRYHVVQSGDSMSPSVTPVARNDRYPVGTYPDTHEDSLVWLNDTMNGSTNGSAANTRVEPFGSPVCQTTGKSVSLLGDKPSGVPNDNHEAVVDDAQVQPPDKQCVTRLVELLTRWGMSEKSANQLAVIPRICYLDEKQLQYAYDYARKHATTDTMAYLDTILRNPNFFKTDRGKKE